MFLWAPFYATGAKGTILREFTDPKWIMEALAEEKGTDILFRGAHCRRYPERHQGWKIDT